MSDLTRELREALDDPRRYEWGEGPWEHLGDAERDVRWLLDEIAELQRQLAEYEEQRTDRFVWKAEDGPLLRNTNESASVPYRTQSEWAELLDRERAAREAAEAERDDLQRECGALAKRMVAAEAERDRLLSENQGLKDALRVALDCRGPYDGTVSRHGGYPAICSECAEKARAALAGLDP